MARIARIAVISGIALMVVVVWWLVWTLASADHSQNDEAADAAIPRQDASTASFEPRLINEETPQRGYGEPQQRPGGGG